MELIDHVVIIFLTFWGTTILFSRASYTILYSHQQCTKGSSFYTCLRTLFVYYFFFIINIQMDVKQRNIVALICISSGISGTENLLMSLLVIYKCFLQETIYLNLWPIFYLDCFFFYLLTCRNSLSCALILDQIYDIFPFHGLPFHSVSSGL